MREEISIPALLVTPFSTWCVYVFYPFCVTLLLTWATFAFYFFLSRSAFDLDYFRLLLSRVAPLPTWITLVFYSLESLYSRFGLLPPSIFFESFHSRLRLLSPFTLPESSRSRFKLLSPSILPSCPAPDLYYFCLLLFSSRLASDLDYFYLPPVPSRYAIWLLNPTCVFLYSAGSPGWVISTSAMKFKFYY